MKVRVLFFANLKSISGAPSVDVELEEGAKVSGLMNKLTGMFPPLKEIIEKRRIFISVNQDMAGKEDALKEGDEVGLLPPFSGG